MTELDDIKKALDAERNQLAVQSQKLEKEMQLATIQNASLTEKLAQN